MKAHGIPDEAMSIGTGYLSNGEYHAVLLLHTNLGDLVMNNMHNHILPWRSVDLTFTKLIPFADMRTAFQAIDIGLKRGLSYH